MSCSEPAALKAQWGEKRGVEEGLSDRPGSGFIGFIIGNPPERSPLGPKRLTEDYRSV
ncbi:hypothetical protein [Laspinema olomoucense]|uniref:hypothetical protein n=1 Tax=Laspinema olomoucense TaxID=3231600 RepID=UPI0021BB11E1|nr:hypothetical protein [Laspinema sp. D3c]MCT7994914.1 hypothetical protein [Laspinema sp. D3c]